MNRTKKLYVLLGVLVVLCAVAFGVSKYEEKKEAIKNSDEIILELASEDIKSISWEYGSDAFAFHQEEGWIYDEDEAFPVDEEKINDLLEPFQEFGVSFVIEDVEDYGQYGLDDPTCTINLETDEKTYEILLGDYSTMDSERYVSIGDGNVYLVKDDPLDTFDVTLSDMILHDEMPDLDVVNTLTFTGAENYQIVYEEENDSSYCEDDIYFTEKDGNQLPLDTAKMEDYLQLLSDLNPKDYVTYKVSDDELAEYGLDEPKLTIKAEYTVTDEESEEESTEIFILNVGCVSEDDEDDMTAYVRVGESKIVYKITSDQYESLIKVSYDDLRHAEVVTAAFSDICQIDISLEGEDYTITVKEEDEEKVYYYGDEEVDIADFKSAFMALEAESFTAEEPTEKEEISLKVYLNDENNSEIDIELYRYDGDSCLAVIDGETVSFVGRTYVVNLVEAVNAIVL